MAAAVAGRHAPPSVSGCRGLPPIRRLPPTPPRLLAATTTACALPLAYYALLGHFDATWRLAGQINNQFPQSIRDLALTLLPLSLLAVVAFRRPPKSFIGAAVLAWPLCALAVFFGIYVTGVGTFPNHALEGISIPLAVLTVVGFNQLFGRLRSPALLVAGCVAVVALLLPVLPGLNLTLGFGKPNIFGADPIFIRTSESDALHYLSQTNASGSVLSTLYLGQIVPAETGRNTWVGIASWTPDFSSAGRRGESLVLGRPQDTAGSEVRRLNRGPVPPLRLQPPRGPLVPRGHHRPSEDPFRVRVRLRVKECTAAADSLVLAPGRP